MTCWTFDVETTDPHYLHLLLPSTPAYLFLLDGGKPLPEQWRKQLSVLQFSNAKKIFLVVVTPSRFSDALKDQMMMSLPDDAVRGVQYEGTEARLEVYFVTEKSLISDRESSLLQEKVLKYLFPKAGLSGYLSDIISWIGDALEYEGVFSLDALVSRAPADCNEEDLKCGLDLLQEMSGEFLVLTSTSPKTDEEFTLYAKLEWVDLCVSSLFEDHPIIDGFFLGPSLRSIFHFENDNCYFFLIKWLVFRRFLIQIESSDSSAFQPISLSPISPKSAFKKGLNPDVNFLGVIPFFLPSLRPALRCLFNWARQLPPPSNLGVGSNFSTLLYHRFFLISSSVMWWPWFLLLEQFICYLPKMGRLVQCWDTGILLEYKEQSSCTLVCIELTQEENNKEDKVVTPFAVHLAVRTSPALPITMWYPIQALHDLSALITFVLKELKLPFEERLPCLSCWGSRRQSILGSEPSTPFSQWMPEEIFRFSAKECHVAIGQQEDKIVCQAGHACDLQSILPDSPFWSWNAKQVGWKDLEVLKEIQRVRDATLFHVQLKDMRQTVLVLEVLAIEPLKLLSFSDPLDKFRVFSKERWITTNHIINHPHLVSLVGFCRNVSLPDPKLSRCGYLWEDMKQGALFELLMDPVGVQSIIKKIYNAFEEIYPCQAHQRGASSEEISSHFLKEQTIELVSQAERYPTLAPTLNTFLEQSKSLMDFTEKMGSSILLHQESDQTATTCVEEKSSEILARWQDFGSLFRKTLFATSFCGNSVSHLSLLNRCCICLDVVIGLGYLHSLSPPLVHLDLRSENIFLTRDVSQYHSMRPVIERDGINVSPTKWAKIGNFAVSTRLSPSPSHFHHLRSSLSSFSPWYLSPELLSLQSREESDLSVELLMQTVCPACDIYSFGLLMWEVFSRCSVETYFQTLQENKNQPFHEFILSGQRPDQEILSFSYHSKEERKGGIGEEEEDQGFVNSFALQERVRDVICRIMEQCWSGDAKLRPTAHEIMEVLTKLIQEITSWQGDKKLIGIPSSSRISGAPMARQRLWTRFSISPIFDRQPKVMCVRSCTTEDGNDWVWVGCRDGAVRVFEWDKAEMVFHLVVCQNFSYVPSPSSFLFPSPSPSSSPPMALRRAGPIPSSSPLQSFLPISNPEQMWGWTESGLIKAWKMSPQSKVFICGTLSLLQGHSFKPFKSFGMKSILLQGVLTKVGGVLDESTRQTKTMRERFALGHSQSSELLKWEVSGHSGLALSVTIQHFSKAETFYSFVNLEELRLTPDVTETLDEVSVLWRSREEGSKTKVTETKLLFSSKLSQDPPPKRAPEFYHLIPPDSEPPFQKILPFSSITQLQEGKIVCSHQFIPLLFLLIWGKKKIKKEEEGEEEIKKMGEGEKLGKWGWEIEKIGLESGQCFSHLLPLSKDRLIIVEKNSLLVFDLKTRELSPVGISSNGTLLCLSKPFDSLDGSKLIWRFYFLIILNYF